MSEIASMGKRSLQDIPSLAPEEAATDLSSCISQSSGPASLGFPSTSGVGRFRFGDVAAAVRNGNGAVNGIFEP